VPGTDAYAGYLMAASGFLALAHTLKRGEHIRVTLFLSALSGGWKKGMDCGRWPLLRHCPRCLPSTAAAWRGSRACSTTFPPAATPRRLWIPQIGMAVGTVILAIAFVDELVLELRGQRVWCKAATSPCATNRNRHIP
jgi:TRAP-type C4-dicarboxylate transport system permease small subunit